MMPVEELPNASWITALALGFLSAVFDNIPLTKLCLDQGHYDWGMLAYSVGFGGSMIWFGSSAGVAITNKFPSLLCTFFSVGNLPITTNTRSTTARFPDAPWPDIAKRKEEVSATLI